MTAPNEQGPSKSIQLPSIPCIDLTKGPSEGTQYKCASFHVSIGRTRHSKLFIKDCGVSEKHAELFWNGSTWSLRDLGSTNGTYVNGQRLQANIEARELCQGDLVRLGPDTEGTVQFKNLNAQSTTVEQLLQAESEVLAQLIMAKAVSEVQAMQQSLIAKKQQVS